MHPFTPLHLGCEVYIQKFPGSMDGVNRAPGACLCTAALAACQPWAQATEHRGGTAKAVIREGETALPW